MKALSLTQPWASLTMPRESRPPVKQVETRSWRTHYVGRIAIHAAKGYPSWARAAATGWQRRGFTHGTLPLGAVIGSAVLLEVTSTVAALNNDRISPLEHEFGDYADGRYAWFLTEAIALPEPIPCKGALGLWTLPGEIEAVVLATLTIGARAFAPGKSVHVTAGALHV